MLPEEWTGHLIGEMHNNRITYNDLGAELGVTNAYISMVLNGKRNPKNGQERFTRAVETISRRKRDGEPGGQER